jgi:hypothetical protein
VVKPPLIGPKLTGKYPLVGGIGTTDSTMSPAIPGRCTVLMPGPRVVALPDIDPRGTCHDGDG